MSEASGTFKSTSDNISESAVRIEDGTEKLDANSGNALSEMDSLSAVIGEVTSNTEEISRLTVETENTINDGIESVEGLTKSAGATADITAEVIASIKDLEEKLKSVHTVVKAINDIAGKTNLLSLNASIEAARAGEAGRGFTVVAEEIRNLSTQCMESAGKISEIVNEVSARTEDVVNTALRAEETVGSQTGAVEKTRDSFETIREQVSSLLSSLETIIENAKRMEDSRVSTLSSIEGISSISGETVSCAADVKGAAEKQKESIENLDRASEQLYAKSEELIKALESFTV
jgi:methyl-accepting chemotaxis protein